jgi:hypothetical protein
MFPPSEQHQNAFKGTSLMTLILILGIRQKRFCKILHLKLVKAKPWIITFPEKNDRVRMMGDRARPA